MLGMDPDIYKSTITYKIHAKQLFDQTYVNQLYLTYRMLNNCLLHPPNTQKKHLDPTSRKAPAGLGRLEFCPSGHEPRLKKVFYKHQTIRFFMGCHRIEWDKK